MSIIGLEQLRFSDRKRDEKKESSMSMVIKGFTGANGAYYLPSQNEKQISILVWRYLIFLSNRKCDEKIFSNGYGYEVLQGHITYPFICNDPETVAMQMHRVACFIFYSLVNENNFHHFIEFHINLVDTLTELLFALLLVNRIFVTKLPLQEIQ